jgi:23S rRNA (pseudouridine1915-N3)-methyltransferase
MLDAMIWRMLVAGEPRLAFARLGCEDYLQRLTRFARFEIRYLPVNRPDLLTARFLSESSGSFRIVLDERGELLNSRQFSQLIQQRQNAGTRVVSLLVGPPDGWEESVRSAADLLLSLSPLTLQHELALVVLLEQLYRGFSILAGTPYHRSS